MRAIIKTITLKELEQLKRSCCYMFITKDAPKENQFKVYLYLQKSRSKQEGVGEVIGEFICEEKYPIHFLTGQYTGTYPYSNEADDDGIDLQIASKMTQKEILKKLEEKDGYGLQFLEITFYNKPHNIDEWQGFCKDNKRDCTACRYSINEEYNLPWKGVESVGCSLPKITEAPEDWIYVEDRGKIEK